MNKEDLMIGFKNKQGHTHRLRPDQLANTRKKKTKLANKVKVIEKTVDTVSTTKQPTIEETRDELIRIYVQKQLDIIKRINGGK